MCHRSGDPTPTQNESTPPSRDVRSRKNRAQRESERIEMRGERRPPERTAKGPQFVPSALIFVLPSLLSLASADAFAQASSDLPADHESNPADPTGGAYTTPTLLFIPAGALPAWNVKVITAVDVQGPTPPDRLAVGDGSFGFQPSLGGELGLPGGFTLGAGTSWVGGDTSPTPVSEGISPYLQARYHIVGADDGRGFQLGTSLTYKFVGFQGDPGELEVAFSGQYRERSYEVGLQAVLGKDFATTDADGEIHAYALYRVIPQLGLGGAGQVRIGLVSQPGETTYDVVGGAMASLTMGVWQIAGLVGASTLGLNQGQVGGFGEAFATVRF